MENKRNEIVEEIETENDKQEKVSNEVKETETEINSESATATNTEESVAENSVESEEVPDKQNKSGSSKIKAIPGIKMIVTDAIMLILLLVFLGLKLNDKLIDVYYNVSRPYHEFMMKACSHVRFSVAELIYIVLVISIVAYIIWSIVHLIKDKDKWLRVYTTLMTLVMISLIIVTAYEYLWTPYYSAPSFSEQSGVSDDSIYTEDLKTVTEYFVTLANEYSRKVDRDENGSCVIDKYDVIARAPKAYEAAAEKWSFLEGEPIEPKAVVCSKVMSFLDFTGFFYPPTGETNVDVDSPAFMLPFTCEHEISHQRGIGPEQECNFIATVACLDSEDDEYIYSGALTAYIYLQNTLKKVDVEAYKEVRAELNETVLYDLKENSDYWDSYSSIISRVSNNAYESFLEGNGQELGLASYGACVNLLVHYYMEKIS